MKSAKILFIFIFIGILGEITNRANNNFLNLNTNHWIDNQGYWTKLASKGMVPYNPDLSPKQAVYTGTYLKAQTVSTLNSPDIPVSGDNTTQSENSVFIDPYDETILVNSNNSTTNPVDTVFGANSLHSLNSGDSWGGQLEGAGENNYGDPSTVINRNGRWFVNYINSSGGMGVSFSDDEGETWTVKSATSGTMIDCDKSHMWIDNNPDSPHEGNIYISWTNVGNLDVGDIGVSYSTDEGETWVMNTNISEDINAGSHNQGVNISTGPDGTVYAVWSVYDSWQSGGSDESAIGMAISIDGGQTWSSSNRIISNIRGIRSTKTSKNMRVNSFPVATVDNSMGADNGSIYVTWANVGVPGQNIGNDINIYVIKSNDKGTSWTNPIKVNQDYLGVGNEHFMPWLTCDPSNGILSMVYYDDRNVGGTECEVFCANSIDGGYSWEEFKVSDVSFTPSPIPGLAQDYMGDYLGIQAKNGIVYPMWTDNRNGYAMTWCSPYETNPLNKPTNVTAEVDFESGLVNLSWEYEYSGGFLYFKIYRDGDSVSTTIDTTAIDQLQEYGNFKYRITAYYENNIESGASGINVSWGAPSIYINPDYDTINERIAIGTSKDVPIQIINTGQLTLNYYITLDSETKVKSYCMASGGGGSGNEYIRSVQVGDINNMNTGSDNYTNYSYLSTLMEVGSSYEIMVTIDNPYDLDKCAVWIDWNINGVFDGNEIIELTGTTLSPYYHGIISPPPGAITGTTIMRIRLQYSGELSPCGETLFGEVEDYSLNVNGWLDIFPIMDTISSMDTGNVTVRLNAINLPEGDYFTNIIINSNDNESGVFIIPVNLDADKLIVTAIAQQEKVCVASVVGLQANVSGIFDSLTYSWTSIPEGFTSNLPRPFVFVTRPTWYIISIKDGENTDIDSGFIDTFQLPTVNIGPDTSLCASESIILDAGAGEEAYLWSTGDTTYSIIVDSTGIGIGKQSFQVDVTNVNGCSITDLITLEFLECTHIPEAFSNNISIYPNPSNGTFIISTSNKIVILEVEITDSKGNSIFYHRDNLPNNTNEIPVYLNNISPGYYSVIITTNKGTDISKIILGN